MTVISKTSVYITSFTGGSGKISKKICICLSWRNDDKVKFYFGVGNAVPIDKKKKKRKNER